MNNGEVAGAGLSRKLAGALANSFVFARARRTWAANSKDWYYPLSKFDKLFTGGYLILSDYSAEQFPPKFEDREKAYAGEINYHFALPGFSSSEPFEVNKPFGNARSARIYMEDYLRMVEILERYGIT